MCAMPSNPTWDTEYDTTTSKSVIQKLTAVIALAWRWSVGVFFTQVFLFSIFVVGWTYRLMQRYALYRFIKLQSKKNAKQEFRRVVQFNPEFQHLQSAPNWFMQQNTRTAFKQHWDESENLWQSIKALFAVPFSSLWLNLKIGVQAILNTYVLTVIPCLLWQFAWHAGWNNSFNKMYEQAHVGAMTGISGIIIFSLIMFYVPMAQARQAVSGEWRAFYQFRTNWRLISSCWFYCAILAGLFSLISLPITIFKTAPGFLPQGNPYWIEAGDTEILQFLNTYFFIVSFFCLAGFIIVKLAATRVYTIAVRQAIRTRRIKLSEFTPYEQAMLKASHTDQPIEQDDPILLIKAGKWFGSKMKTILSIILILVFWITFVFQIYVSEFLNYHIHTRAWMNQPLIHFPVFRYVPDALEQRVKEEHKSKETIDME